MAPSVRFRVVAAVSDERVTELEIHVAHLESAQDELGEVLIRQQALLEALTTQVERLTRRLEQQPPGDSGDDAPGAGREPGED